jgi:DNA invertase Pin-like site-specific DNA recombinase
MIHVYARVSNDGQSVDARVRQLKAAGARNVWRETAGGTKTDRVRLRRVLDQRDAGDVLMVTRRAAVNVSGRQEFCYRDGT